MSLHNYLVLLLRLIFPLHFEKANVIILNILFLILFLIFIYHPLYVHFFGHMLDFQECIKNTISSKLDSGDVRGDGDLRAEWDLTVGHTSTREESYWVQVALHYQVKPKQVSRARLVTKGYSQVYRTWLWACLDSWKWEKMGCEKTHFSLSVFVLNRKWKMRKPFSFSLFSFPFYTFLHYHFSTFRALQLILWSCKSHFNKLYLCNKFW